MKFEWGLEKAGANLRKHGVSFDAAAKAFEDELSVTFPDPDHPRGDTARIISARVATTKERKRYEA
jgi:uncharacterized protein